MLRKTALAWIVCCATARVHRLHVSSCARRVYRCAKQHSEPGSHPHNKRGANVGEIALTLLEQIDRIAKLVPPARTQASLLRCAGTELAEMSGCSLCMGNQAQVREGATAVSSSTRNLLNRLGKGTNVFLVSAELAAVCSKLGCIPTVAEYMEAVGVLNKDSVNIYKDLNFDQIEEYVENAA